MSDEFHNGYIEGYKAATGHIIGHLSEKMSKLSQTVEDFTVKVRQMEIEQSQISQHMTHNLIKLQDEFRGLKWLNREAAKTGRTAKKSVRKKPRS